MDLQSVDLGATIMVILEDTGDRFAVHKEFICAQSTFVEGCLQKKIIEERE